MASIDDTVVATELVSKPQKLAAPRYRYMKVLPMSGSAEQKIATGGRPTVQFEIPTQSFNYSKSYICGRITTGETGAAGRNQWLYKDVVSWCNRVSFKTRGGAVLFDLDYLSNYTKVVNRYETPLEEVMAGDETDVMYACRASAIVGEGKRPNNTSVDHPMIEGGYLMSGVARVGADGAITTSAVTDMYFRIPLSRFVPNSVFSRKSDLKFPEIAILTVVLGPGTKISWEGTDPDNPTSGVVACRTETLLNDFYLHMAKQDDPVYESMQDERIRAGFSIPINVPIQSMTLHPSAGQHNIAVTYNSGHGHRLVKIYHSMFNTVEEKNTAFDHNALNKMTSYYVKIQGSRTTDEDLKISGVDPSAYMYHKYLLEGTSITNANIFHQNFAHIEDVGRVGGPQRWKELGFRKDDADVGVPLNQDYKFEFVATLPANASYQHYTFAVVQRLLTMNSSGVLVE